MRLFACDQPGLGLFQAARPPTFWSGIRRGARPPMDRPRISATKKSRPCCFFLEHFIKISHAAKPCTKGRRHFGVSNRERRELGHASVPGRKSCERNSKLQSSAHPAASLQSFLFLNGDECQVSCEGLHGRSKVLGEAEPNPLTIRVVGWTSSQSSTAMVHGLAACDIFTKCWRQHSGKPAIAQLVEFGTNAL